MKLQNRPHAADFPEKRPIPVSEGEPDRGPARLRIEALEERTAPIVLWGDVAVRL